MAADDDNDPQYLSALNGPSAPVTLISEPSHL